MSTGRKESVSAPNGVPFLGQGSTSQKTTKNVLVTARSLFSHKPKNLTSNSTILEHEKVGSWIETHLQHRARFSSLI
jgi:hypothetical protein